MAKEQFKAEGNEVVRPQTKVEQKSVTKEDLVNTEFNIKVVVDPGK